MEKLTTLRKRVDLLAAIAQDREISYEVGKCREDLLLGKAWLGKALGATGKPTPYTNDGSRKVASDIEPTAEKSTRSQLEIALDALKNNTHIEVIDYLREEIRVCVAECDEFAIDGAYGFLENAKFRLSEARFWLGFEMERIREEFKETQS
jgi:hypothetical protein